jgi:hypothetical protein
VQDAEGTGFLTGGHSAMLAGMVENASAAPRHQRSRLAGSSVHPEKVAAYAHAKRVTVDEARAILELRAAGVAMAEAERRVLR